MDAQALQQILAGQAQSFQQALEATLEQKKIFETRCNELQQSQKALEDRLEHSLTRNRVLESEIEQWKQAQREADTKLHQAQVDLAKQDNEISQLKQLLTDSQAEVQRLKKQNDQLLNSAIEQVSKLAENSCFIIVWRPGSHKLYILIWFRDLELSFW